MSTGTESVTPPDRRTGRYNQRQRTRQAILQAAQQMVEAGHEPTVAEAADAALVSRATAYRYFPSQDELLVECTFHVGWPSLEELFARADMPTGAEDRVAYIHDFLYEYIRERETQFRQYFRRQLYVSMQPNSEERAVRPGYRIGMIRNALAPIADELGPERLLRLQHALGVLIGTEALIASADILHLDHDTARADNQWACRLLVRAALSEAAAEPAPPTKRTRTGRTTRR